MTATAQLHDMFRTPSPVSKWLGMRLVSHDQATMTSRLAFEPSLDARNYAGNVQGGIVVAMLDNAMGYNAFVSLGSVNQQTTIDIQTQFINPVPPQAVEVEAKVLKAGGSIVFLEGSLFTHDGTLAARATSTMKIRPMTKGPTANTAANPAE